MLGPIFVEQQISDPFIQLIEEIYTPKSFSYLSHAISLLSNHLYELLVDLILLQVLVMSCLTFQSLRSQKLSGSIGKIYLSQNKWEKSDLCKG